LSKNVVVLNEENWRREVMEAEGPVLVDFWAGWCAPCRMIAPAVAALADAYAGRAKVGKLDVDESPEIAESFNVRSIPTLIVFKNGRVVDQRVGAVPQPIIAEMLESQVAPAGVVLPHEGQVTGFTHLNSFARQLQEGQAPTPADGSSGARS